MCTFLRALFDHTRNALDVRHSVLRQFRWNATPTRTLRFTARDKMVKKKAAKWNPGLNSKYKAGSAVGRPTKRWEDDIN